MTTGLVAWLNTRWDYGVIWIPDRYVTFPSWELKGTVGGLQRVSFDLVEHRSGPDAHNVVPQDGFGRPDDIPGCPRCASNPIDEGVRVHEKRWSRDTEVYLTLSCYQCVWEQPERLVTMIRT